MTVTADQAPAARQPVDVVLTTGELAVVRPIRPGDEPGLRALYKHAAQESLRLRFFSYSPLAADRDLDRMLIPSSSRHLAYVATIRDQVMGMGCVEATSRSGVGDIALLVDDDRHGDGVGMLLIEHLVAAARRAGFHTIRADVLAENTRMLRVFRDLGAKTTKTLDYGVYEIEFSLGPNESWQQAVEVREAIADHASIDRVLAPRSVVVVGAGQRADSIGHRVLDAIRAGGFTGDVYAVNRDGNPVSGVPASTSVADLPVVPDLAIIAVPAVGVAGVIRDCADAGALGAVVISDGFAELGEDGRQLQHEIVSTARSAGMRLIGPNCLGIVNTNRDVRLNATFADLSPIEGRVGVASQSGGVGIAVIDHLSRHGIGVSSFVSLGNKADVSGNDLLMYWERDDATKICMLYLESFGNARKFARIAARVARSKPIVAITAGRSEAGARGVRSHTAAAATPAVVLDALFGQAGVIRAGSLGEAMDVVTLLDRAPLPAGRRIAVLTNGGGPGALAADAAIATGLELPELSSALQMDLRSGLPAHAATQNPVDTTAGSSVEVLAACARKLLASDEIDSVMVVHTSLSRDDTKRLNHALEKITAESPTKALVVVFVGNASTRGCSSPLPVYDFPEPAARALSAVASYAEWRAAPPVAEPELRGIRRRAADREVRTFLANHPEGGWFDTDRAAALVRSYGIHVAPTARASTIRKAIKAAESFHFPVAVKSGVGSMLHRTENGAVRLNIGSDGELRDAVSAIIAACGKPVIVQPMQAAGVETAIGVVNDRSVGPVVMLALGGVASDLLADRTFRIPPIGHDEASAMIHALRTSPLLFGYRGAPAADVASLKDLLVRVGRLAQDIPELAELDLNPVIVTPDAAIAVDVKVRLQPAVSVNPYLRRLPLAR